MLDLDDVENMDKFVGDIIHISFKLLTSWQNEIVLLHIQLALDLPMCFYD